MSLVAISLIFILVILYLLAIFTAARSKINAIFLIILTNLTLLLFYNFVVTNSLNFQKLAFFTIFNLVVTSIILFKVISNGAYNQDLVQKPVKINRILLEKIILTIFLFLAGSGLLYIANNLTKNLNYIAQQQITSQKSLIIVDEITKAESAIFSNLTPVILIFIIIISIIFMNYQRKN